MEKTWELPDFLKDLNERQLEAATHTEGPMLILAGAGSGKTKTLVSRTVNIVYSGLSAPEEILVLTFTKKAANEMKERGSGALGRYLPGLAGRSAEFTTFHSWGLRFLKRVDPKALALVGLRPGIVIADEKERENIVKSFINTRYRGEKIKIQPLMAAIGKIEYALANSPEEILAGEIGDETNELLCGILPVRFDSKESRLSELFEIKGYLKSKLREGNMVDYDDMITLPYLILKHVPEIRENVQRKYRYIMVDEFQDTNLAQLELLSLMVDPETENICVVGDDFQSIYGWRGAEINNILHFHEKSSKTKIVNLNTNYRSAEKIVAAGNRLLDSAIISHSEKERLLAYRKEMEGYIEASGFESPSEEGEYIADKIESLLTAGTSPREIAVLSRVNSTFRFVENALIAKGIGYKLYGGKSFLERKFVRAVVAYLKFLVAGTDILFETFSRELGLLTEKQISLLKEEAQKRGETLYSVARIMVQEGEGGIAPVRIRGQEKREIFLKAVGQMEKDRELAKGDFEALLDRICDPDEGWIPYMESMKRSKSESAAEKAMENLSNLDRIREISLYYSDIDSFLEGIYLDEERDGKENTEKVSLMSIHRSKGLEFENVFVAAFADQILPSYKSIGSLKKEEEERRLAYVAVTRAKKRLYLTYSIFYPFVRDRLSVSRYFQEAKIFELADKVNIL